jgi:2-dehydro-3-deoxygluconokinase
MKKTERAFRRLEDRRLIALLAPKSAAQCLSAFETLDPLGVTLEVAFRTEAALDGIREVIARHPEALVLAGTVMTRDQARAAIAAGAAGIVSADYIPAVVEACVEADVMSIPGGLGDAGKQLVRKAEVYGCGLEDLREKFPYQWIYKLFPAVSGGRDNLGLAAAWRGPFKGLTVVYTGGVNLGNLADLAAKDPEGIFCGSALAEKAGDPPAMEAEARRWIAAVEPKPAKAAPGSGETAIPPVGGKTAAGPAPKVVTFGEIMLRLSPPGLQRFVQARSFEATFGGAEVNAAVSLAQFGLRSCFVTALPENDLGRAAAGFLRSFAVDTSRLVYAGKRLGIYFHEYGAAQRPSKVIYDRAGSAIAEIKPGTFPWDEIFEGAAWFHWSGITPALSSGAAAATAEAVRAAKRAGAMVSADLNYRKKLWSREDARATMTPLMEFTDVVFGNEEDASDIFGIAAPGADAAGGKIDLDGYRFAAEELARRFGFQKVGVTLRESLSASVNRWSGCLWNGREFVRSRVYEIQVVDRIGSGDAFSAGFISAHLSGKSDREALEFAAAASALKHTIHGDFNLVTEDEVEALARGGGSGRVQR